MRRDSSRTLPPSLPCGVVIDADDAELVRRTRAGDAAAFDQLVRRHFRSAYTAALSVMRNTMDAEDVCQDAFVRALERLEECREPARFGAWLGQITRRRALNALDARRVRSTEPLEPDVAPGPDDAARDVERAELGGQLLAALARLSETQRTVVLMHDMDGRTHREIADMVGCSEGMSRQHLFAARRLLRGHLGETRDG
jgi:RNA polymerase sigma-70 factor (ECF subfamily)